MLILIRIFTPDSMEKIYLAPLQGFTDYIYRKAYSAIFDQVDAFYIPYISVKNRQIINKYAREVDPLNNPLVKVIPQVLAKNAEELLFLSGFLQDHNYKEINLNLGCPYPMVTRQKRGAGLLPHPQELRNMLHKFFHDQSLNLSVKIRAGMHSANELEKVIAVLNDFPLTNVILHPRIAKQLYSGDIISGAFQFAYEKLNHTLVYNGNIFSLSDYNERRIQFPEISNWMLGRGILMNPFLPAEIKGLFFSEETKAKMLKEFHSLIYKGYLEKMDNPGNALNKMQQFWSYFSYCFPNQRKTFKSIKKSKNITVFEKNVQVAFNSLY